MLATVEVNVYGVLALAVAGVALWIAAMVFYRTYVIITITTRSDILGHKGWYLKGAKICLGSACGDGESILITVGDGKQLLPPGVWSEADGTFLSMIDGRSLRGRKSNEWLVLARRNSLPTKALDHIDARKPSAFYRS